MRQQTMRQDQPPPFASTLGIKVISYAPERIEAELPVRPELGNRNGNLHGGAVMAFADDLGGAATILNLPEGATTATIESKTNFFAAINVGDVAKAECTALHRGPYHHGLADEDHSRRWQTRRHRDPDPARDCGDIRQIACRIASRMTKNLAPSIVWFRDELRLGDHPALAAGAKAGAPLVCVYVLDEASAGFARLAGPRDGGSRNRCARSMLTCESAGRGWCFAAARPQP